MHDYVVVTMSGILVLLVVLALLAAFGVWKHLRDGRMRAHSASTPHLPAERIGQPLGEKATPSTARRRPESSDATCGRVQKPPGRSASRSRRRSRIVTPSLSAPSPGLSRVLPSRERPRAFC